MKFLLEIKNFFIKEKIYTAMFLIILAFYGTLMLKGPTEERREVLQHSQGVLKNMESKMTQNSDELFQKNPVGMSLLSGLMILFFGTCFMGLIILIRYFFNLSKGRDWLQTSEKEPNVLWNIGDIFKCIVLILFISLMINESFELVKEFLFKNLDSEIFVLFLTFLLDLIAAGFVLYFITKKSNSTLQDAGFGKPNFPSDAKIGALSYIAFSPILVLVFVVLSQAADFFHYEPPPHELIHVFLDQNAGWGTFVFSFILACIAGPIIEELFFRGFCYSAFKKKWGTRPALILSAAFFALTHGSLFAFFPVFVLGLLLAYVFEKRKSLYASIAIHILHNSVFILYFFLMKSVTGIDL